MNEEQDPTEQADFNAEFLRLGLESAARKATIEKHGALVDGSTGEEVIKTPDELAPAFVEAQGRLKASAEWRDDLKLAIVDLVKDSPGKGRTRRLEGAGVVIKVVLPGVEYDRAALRDLWAKYPTIAPKYLKIAEVTPIAVEVEKLLGTTCAGELMEFAQALHKAKSQGTRSDVTVEKDSRQ